MHLGGDEARVTERLCAGLQTLKPEFKSPPVLQLFD